MENGKQPLIPTVYRKTGENEYKIASEKERREGVYLSTTSGLTKREYFAGLAMQGMLANHHIIDSGNGVSYVAEHAVKMADELLKQLES